MKKYRFYVLSGLVSVFLISSYANAALALEAEKKAPPSEQTQETQPLPPRGRRLPPVALSEEKMKEVYAEMDKLKEATKDMVHEEMTLRRKLHDILVASTFDREAYLATHADIEKLHIKLAGMRAESIANLADHMTAKERIGLPRALMGGYQPRKDATRPQGGRKGPPVDQSDVSPKK